jgi:hypothetical protein
MSSSGRLRHVALVRINVSEEPSASIIRVTRIGELETTLAITSNWHTLQLFLYSVSRLLLWLMLFLVHQFLSPWWWRCQVPPKRRFLQEPHDITSQKMAFFIVTTVKTSNLTCFIFQNSIFMQSSHRMLDLWLTFSSYPFSFICIVGMTIMGQIRWVESTTWSCIQLLS